MPISKSLRDAKESAENLIILTDAETAVEDRPNYECEAYRGAEQSREILRDVMGGTRQMREKRRIYLPQFEAEVDKDYKVRLKRAVLFNAVERTVGGLTGMVFRKDPVLDDDVPAKIRTEAENVDLAGRDLTTFSKDLFRDGLTYGLGFVHVDRPETPTYVRWKSQEKALGLRPYWIHVGAKDVINWNWAIVNGAPVLQLIVYREQVLEDSGRFGQKLITRYRELRPGEYRVWQELDTEKGKAFQVTEEGPVSLDYIPFFPFYAKRSGFFESPPPLLDMAYLNIEHWQVGSEHQNARTIASVPVLFLKGCSTDEGVKYGPNYTLEGETGDADAKWLETSGNSLNQTRQDLKDIEQRMAALGLAMLVRETRAAETAEAKTIDKSESDSALSTAARGLQDCLTNVLQAHADLSGAGDGGSVIINRDFREDVLVPALIAELRAMRAEGDLSRETFWRILQSGEVLPDDFKPEEEQERLETEDALTLGGRLQKAA